MKTEYQLTVAGFQEVHPTAIGMFVMKFGVEEVE